MAIRIVLAEDEAIIRLDLRECLQEEGYEIVGDVGRGDKAVAMVRDLKPDVAIFDIKDRRQMSSAAPPKGLFLMKVSYPS